MKNNVKISCSLNLFARTYLSWYNSRMSNVVDKSRMGTIPPATKGGYQS